MASLRAIKNKISSVKKTHQVTKAMETVSATKMRKAQSAALRARQYAVSAFKILARISDSIDLSSHPLVKKTNNTETKKKILMVVISSDRGLAGGLNSSLFRLAQRTLRDKGVDFADTSIITIGKKAEGYFSFRGYFIKEKIASMGDLSETNNFNEVVESITKLYLQDEYSECLVVYTNFLSTFEQKPVARTLLPLSIDTLKEMIDGIAPAKGKFSENKVVVNTENLTHVSDYLFEPDPEAVFTSLIPRLLAIELHHAFLESKASEHSARMIAMRNASDKAKEVTFTLTRDFNKARQSAITREVSEIIGGIEAMK